MQFIIALALFVGLSGYLDSRIPWFRPDGGGR